MVMAPYGIATSPLDYTHCLHLDDHTRSLHDALRPNSFDPANYLPELECPPCDHRPGWKNSYWVADCSVPDKTYHRLCRVPDASSFVDHAATILTTRPSNQ